MAETIFDKLKSKGNFDTQIIKSKWSDYR